MIPFFDIIPTWKKLPNRPGPQTSNDRIYDVVFRQYSSGTETLRLLFEFIYPSIFNKRRCYRRTVWHHVNGVYLAPGTYIRTRIPRLTFSRANRWLATGRRLLKLFLQFYHFLENIWMKVATNIQENNMYKVNIFPQRALGVICQVGAEESCWLSVMLTW